MLSPVLSHWKEPLLAPQGVSHSSVGRDAPTWNQRFWNAANKKKQKQKQTKDGDKRRELTKQGAQQRRPESPTVTPTGLRVNTRYTNSTKGTCSNLWWGLCPFGGIYMPCINLLVCGVALGNSVLLCPLSFEHCYLPMFADFTQAI